MALKKRLFVLIKSQFNSWITQVEDPEKIMDQAVQDMEEGLDNAKGKLGMLRSRLEEELRFLERVDKQIVYWQERAEELLRGDMKENAKDAIRRRRVLDQEKRRLKNKSAEDELDLREMEVAVKELEVRVHSARSKRNILIKNLRLRRGITAGAGEDVEESRAIEIKEPFALFRKMEERVEGGLEFIHSRLDRKKEDWEREEKLINEEIEALKRSIKKKQ